MSGEHKMKIAGLMLSEEVGKHRGIENNAAVEYVGDISQRSKDGTFDVRSTLLNGSERGLSLSACTLLRPTLDPRPACLLPSAGEQPRVILEAIRRGCRGERAICNDRGVSSLSAVRDLFSSTPAQPSRLLELAGPMPALSSGNYLRRRCPVRRPPLTDALLSARVAAT